LVTPARLPGRFGLHHRHQVDVADRALAQLELALDARAGEQRLERRALGREREVAVELAGHRDRLGEGAHQLRGVHLGEREVAFQLHRPSPT
jgi:hypothetical protein